MILIISNIANDAATTLADMFSPGYAAVVTASQFHHSFKGGFNVNSFAQSPLIIHGKKIKAGDISGVVTTIPHFFAQEFYYIDPADREYVCSEMNAFFIYFLTELKCPKLNPPSMRSFAGPGIFKIELLNIAFALQVPVWPAHLVDGRHIYTQKDANVEACTYTAIGETIIGPQAKDKAHRYIKALQKALGTPYLQCYFIKEGDEYYLCDVITLPDITNFLHREAIVDYFIKTNLYDTVMGTDGRLTYGNGTH